ncbi:unnamed protein product [Rodentolepis nana]|uniref:Uncharacterized protein n=1 Tax=Rodentolepis nana TaxID=102285 RepID=A0A3P7V7X1_RODNA|nr:unnamed protein product [Rodentolepis nana]
MSTISPLFGECHCPLFLLCSSFEPSLCGKTSAGFLIKFFIVWKDIDRSMPCKIVVPFLANYHLVFFLSAADTVFYIHMSQLFWLALCFQLSLLLTVSPKGIPLW